MRWLFFVFLVANALVYALVNFGGGSSAIDPRSREINASQVRIVTGQLAARTAVSSGTASVPQASAPLASAVAKAEAPKPEPSSPVADAQPKTVCLRWSGLTAELAEQARGRIKALGLSATEIGGSENAKVWVYIPPLATHEAALEKARQLKEMGVEDYFVVNDGKRWQNSVSLGLFSTREAGERRLAELRAKGVRSAVLRDKDDTLKPLTFHLKNVSAQDRQKLEKSGGKLASVPLREVACK